MVREIIKPLRARGANGSPVVFEPGALISSCAILRNHSCETTADAEVYSMDFEVQGEHHCCPLVEFLARTEAIVPAEAGQIPAQGAAGE